MRTNMVIILQKKHLNNVYQLLLKCTICFAEKMKKWNCFLDPGLFPSVRYIAKVEKYFYNSDFHMKELVLDFPIFGYLQAYKCITYLLHIYHPYIKRFLKPNISSGSASTYCFVFYFLFRCSWFTSLSSEDFCADFPTSGCHLPIR